MTTRTGGAAERSKSMNKEYWDAILMRAWHAVWETAGATLPASIIITPAMIEHFDWKVVYVVLGWALTAIVAGGLSVVKSLAAGVPEAEYTKVVEPTEHEEAAEPMACDKEAE